MASISRNVLADFGDSLMSDEEKAFVNRHGHKVSVGDADFEAPPVSHPAGGEQLTKEQAKPEKVRKVSNKKLPKQLVLFTVVILIGLLLVPVLSGEIVRARYASSQDGARTQLIEFATKTVVPQQKQQMKIAQLSETADRVEKIRDDACDGGFTDNLAMIYPRAKTAFDECIGFKLKVAAAASSLRELESQVRYLDALAPVIESVAKETSEGFAIISAQHENWRTLDEALGRLSPAASQRAAHDKLKLQSNAIVDAWSALNTANNNQDSSGFTSAEKKLTEAYEAFRTSSTALSDIMNETQTKLTAAYKAL